MPLNVAQPGTYIAEPPAQQGVITPVSTSLTAFVGRAATGPVDCPVTISSLGDFVRFFGAVDRAFPMTVAVRDFFENGGGGAVIVRLYEPVAPTDGVARMSIGDGDTAFELCAASPGAWGNRLTATIDTADITEVTARQFKEPYSLGAADLFNLTLALHNEAGTVVMTERHLNLSIRNDGAAASFPKRIDRALHAMSALGAVEHLPAARADPGSWTATGGGDGAALTEATYLGDQSQRTGLYALEAIALFNLLVVPPDQPFTSDRPDAARDLPPAVRLGAATYCTGRRAFFIVDPPFAWRDRSADNPLTALDRDALGVHGVNAAGQEIARNAALYFPFLWGNGDDAPRAPSGAVAGVIAATDISRGVWKAPAGVTTGLGNVAKLDVALNDTDNGRLNELGINCLRDLPSYGPVIMGARTLRGADQFEDDYKYVPVRRLALFIEQSILAGTQWAVFEPNSEQLWSSLRLSIDTFMADLARQGAFYNYHVVCDATTTTPDDIDRGIVNILVYFAPVTPEEIIVLQFQLSATRPAD